MINFGHWTYNYKSHQWWTLFEHSLYTDFKMMWAIQPSKRIQIVVTFQRLKFSRSSNGTPHIFCFTSAPSKSGIKVLIVLNVRRTRTILHLHSNPPEIYSQFGWATGSVANTDPLLQPACSLSQCPLYQPVLLSYVINLICNLWYIVSGHAPPFW